MKPAASDTGKHLPPTLRLFVMLWEEIRSYCVHAIQFSLLRCLPSAAAPSLPPPAAHAPPLASTSERKKAKSSSKRVKRSGAVFPTQLAPAAPVVAAGKDGLDEAEQMRAIERAVNIEMASLGPREKGPEEFLQKCEMCGNK